MKRKKVAMLIGGVTLIIVAIVTILLINNKGHRVIKVESFSGKVTLERDDSEKEIFKNMNLKTEDIITTGEDGLIGLLVDDDKNIAAVENTCFAIVSKGNAKKGALKIELKYGTSLIEIKNKLPDGSSFEVETPNASLSVKGTVFEVRYNPETQATILKVTEGRVQVDTKAKTDVVNAGETAIIKDDNIEVSESDGNKEDIDSPTALGYVKDEDWQKLLKGGADYEQLQYLLKVVSYCEYEKETDYLKNALYWLGDQTSAKTPIEPIERLGDGRIVYDVSEVNKILTLITEDTISEENLTPGVNSLDGERLICATIPTDVDRIPSAGISNAYYIESGEIIVEYLFNVVHSDTLEVERFEKKVHLILDETGKYVLSHIE